MATILQQSINSCSEQSGNPGQVTQTIGTSGDAAKVSTGDTSRRFDTQQVKMPTEGLEPIFLFSKRRKYNHTLRTNERGGTR